MYTVGYHYNDLLQDPFITIMKYQIENKKRCHTKEQYDFLKK